MSDPLHNPYAPPAAPAIETRPEGAGPSSYDAEVRSVMLLIVLSVITFGLYPGFWYIRRARFIDSLDSSKRVGSLPWVSLGLLLVFFLVSAARVDANVGRLFQGASGLTYVFLAFRIAAILRSDFARTGRAIAISSVGVFFFGCLYLQHIMNEAASFPARRPREAASTPAA